MSDDEPVENGAGNNGPAEYDPGKVLHDHMQNAMGSITPPNPYTYEHVDPRTQKFAELHEHRTVPESAKDIVANIKDNRNQPPKP
jgi:hypothetical protein